MITVLGIVTADDAHSVGAQTAKQIAVGRVLRAGDGCVVAAQVAAKDGGVERGIALTE